MTDPTGRLAPHLAGLTNLESLRVYANDVGSRLKAVYRYVKQLGGTARAGIAMP
jgi:hypothetical protein